MQQSNGRCVGSTLCMYSCIIKRFIIPALDCALLGCNARMADVAVSSSKEWNEHLLREVGVPFDTFCLAPVCIDQMVDTSYSLSWLHNQVRIFHCFMLNARARSRSNGDYMVALASRSWNFFLPVMPLGLKVSLLEGLLGSCSSYAYWSAQTYWIVIYLKAEIASLVTDPVDRAAHPMIAPTDGRTLTCSYATPPQPTQQAVLTGIWAQLWSRARQFI